MVVVLSGDLIREARLRAGLTQDELGERTGRDRAVIARWEQGAVTPSMETVIELVRA
jgi:transcriptional regulator with XRE-family HTH domain